MTSCTCHKNAKELLGIRNDKKVAKDGKAFSGQMPEEEQEL